MGLAISVGSGQFDEDLEELSSELLDSESELEWREPSARSELKSRADITSFSYSNIHYLRRAYARLRAGLPVTPVESPSELDADKQVVEEETLMMESHLLCHSDADGYYIPVDFEIPEVIEDELVGSSQRLLDELRFVAPALGITLEPDGSLSDSETERINVRQTEFPNEWLVWLALYEACRISVETGHAIVFC